MNVTQLTSQSAKLAHQELLASLGTENNPQQWMVFMSAVDKHIPEMASKGRLPTQTIERSLIGQLGFKSWKGYVESSLDKGGLNWSIGGWNSFRRAWSIVKDYPFLKQQEVTAGWLNSFSNELKKDDIEFPKNKRELEDIQQARAENKAENKNTQLTEAKQKIKELEAQSNAFKSKNGHLFIENTELKAKVDGFELAVALVLDKNLKKIEVQANQIATLKNQISNLKGERYSRWEALKMIFSR